MIQMNFEILHIVTLKINILFFFRFSKIEKKMMYNLMNSFFVLVLISFNYQKL